MARIALVGGLGDVVAKVRGTLLRTLRDAGHEVIVSVPLPATEVRAEVEAELGSLGCRIDWSPLDRAGTNPWRERRLARHYGRLFLATRPDAVLAYNPKPIFHALPAARRAGVPRTAALVTGLGFAFTHRSPRARLLAWAATRWYRRALRCADAALFQNPDDAVEFHRRGLLPPGLAVTALPGVGVDLGHFAPCPPAAESDRPEFLYLGRILADKGIRELVAAAGILRAEGRSFRLRLVGPLDVNPSAITRAELESWCLEGVLAWDGRASDVRPALAACRALVLPSYREGFPNAAAEAMASARAVIATDVPGCRDAVVPGVTGLLVPPRDAGGLAAAMRQLLADRELAIGMGEAGRRRAEERFDARRVDRLILAALGLELDSRRDR